MEDDNELVNVDWNLYNGLREIPKRIFDIILDFIENKRYRSILCLNIFPNAGKTYIAAMITSMLNTDVLPFVYFTLNYRIAEDFIKFKEENFNDFSCELLRGKSYENKITLERECTDDLGFALAKKYGQNGFYCKTGICPDWETCVHRLTINEVLNSNPPISWAGHFLHYPTLFKIYKKKWLYRDILKIMDEDMSNTFFVQENFSIHRINESIDNSEDRTLIIFFDLIYNSIEDYNRLPYSPKKLREDCEERYENDILTFLRDVHPSDIKKAKKNYDQLILDKFRTDAEVKYKNPYNFLEEFKFFVDNYRADKLSGFLSIYTYAVGFDYYRMIREMDNMIILNATFESELFKCLVPDGTDLIIENVPGKFSINQKIFAIKGREGSPKYATYPLRSLYKNRIYSDKFYELVNISRIFAKRHKKTVIFCVNKLENELSKCFSKEIKEGSVSVDTFAWAIGKNQYREEGNEYDGCVIFGTPYHNVGHLKKMIKLYRKNEKIIFRNETHYKIEQAINRIGLLTWKESKRDGEILILSSLDLPNLKFVDGHEGIQRYRLIDLYRVLDDNYIDLQQKNILKGINEHGILSITEIKKKVTGSHSKIIIKIHDLLKRGYIKEEIITGRGRPRKLFFITKKGIERII